jgi:N-acetylmuramoyl-L-alanine amidase
MRFVPFAIVVLLLVALSTGALLSFEDQKLVVFGSRGRVEAEMATENGTQYVNLGGVLLAEGDFSTRSMRDGLRYELAGRRVEARIGAREVRAEGNRVRLDAPVVLRADQAWIPASNIADVLRTLLKKPAMLRGGRLLIGDAADFITTEFRPGEPSSVILHFRQPVNPVIDTAEGKITLAFRNEPIAMNTAKVEYGDKALNRLEFSESAGVAQISVQGGVPLMAKFEDGNRRIVITAAPAPVAAAAQTTPAATPPTTETSAPGATTSTSPAQPAIAGVPNAVNPQARTAVVAIDPAHGGNDPGVKFSDKLLEKNVSLAIAEKLRAELNNRGISTIMLRNGDDDVNPDDRAETANAAHVSYYIAIHAGQMGTGVRVYTPLPNAAAATHSLFKPWDQVQADHGDNSNQFAAGVASQLADKKIPVRQLSGNVAPLAHVAAAAVSIEVAPAERNDESTLESSPYIQKLAQAIASAVAQEKARP